jgi:CBS domain-containing protein
MLRLRDIMTTDVVTVTPRTTLRDAAELFAARHVSGAPVVEGAKVVGVLSVSDILTFEASTPGVPTEAGEAEASGEWGEIPGWEVEGAAPVPFFREAAATADETWSELPEPGGVAAEGPAEAAGPEWDPLSEHTVAEAMTRPVYALRPTLDVSAAADRMRSAGIHRVLVMEGGTLLGVVTTMDLVRAVADHRITDRAFVPDSSGDEYGREEAGERIPGGGREEDLEAARVETRVDERGEPLGEERAEAPVEDV